MANLTNKVALVTGSVSGIGRGIVDLFASIGAKVVVHGPDDGEASRVAAELRAGGSDASFVAGDLGDPDVCRHIVRSAIERHGRIDVLVNNAASTARGSLEESTLEFWDRIMAVNLRAPFLCMQEAIRSMKARGGGSIVNIGSVNAYIGLPNLGPYSVSKGGLMTMTRNAAVALNQHRIRVNQLNIGWTLTEGENKVQLSDGKGADWLQNVLPTRPFGRLLLPRDIALAAAYFASDDSELVTGTVMDLEQTPVGALSAY